VAGLYEDEPVPPQRSTRSQTAVQSKTAVLGWVLPVVVAVLLVVTTVALAVSHSTELSSTRLDTPDLGLALGLFVAAATIIGLILWIVILATEENAHGAPPKRRKGRFISQISLLVLALAVLFLYRRRDRGPVDPVTNLASPIAGPGGGTGIASPVAAPASGGGGFFLLFILGSVVAAGVLAGLILARRARREALDLDDELAEPDAAGDLSAALSAAERASYVDDDPRMVIIGCYEALEGVLARRGISRGRAETASAVLASAERAGLLSRTGAGQAAGLVEIFERARFSPHDMTSRDVDEARGRLAALRADIAARRLSGEFDGQRSEQPVAGAAEAPR
jgi:hypothetical protein